MNSAADITFKKTTTVDVDVFLEVMETAYGQKTYVGIADRNKANEEIENNEVYLVMKENEVAGVIDYQINSPNHAHIAELVVLPRFQGQGIARKAATFCLEKLKDTERVDLVTHPRNRKIITLALSLGFYIESWQDNYYGDDEPRLVLVHQR